jgi:hypothetical protein
MGEKKLKNESGFDSGLEIFPGWHFRDSLLPARSCLFSLPPINVGTFDVESLTSYISRLSFEYLLFPTSLLKYGLPENMTFPVNIKKAKKLHLSNGKNGMNELTDALVNALQQATMRDDLYFTTLLTWKDKVSEKNLFHSHKFWCPVCFYEQKNESGINYEKLIWALKPTTKCLKHQRILENKCSNCNRLLSVFTSRTRPGYCSNCFKWLGKKSVSSKRKKISSSNDENLINILFEKMIERSSLAKLSPEPSHFAHNLSNIIKERVKDNL